LYFIFPCPLLSISANNLFFMDDSFLDIHEASRLTGYSVHTLYKKVARGEVPFYKSGRRNIFLKHELIGWMKGEVAGGASPGKVKSVRRGLVKGICASCGVKQEVTESIDRLIDNCFLQLDILSGEKSG